MSDPPATVVSVNLSDGGIPKRPVEVGQVLGSGLRGDAHDHEKHDTPLQAICIIDEEDLDDLRCEGFEVYPGSTGENLTVRGLEIDALAVGDRLRLSGGVELELTKRRKPCYVLDAISPDLKTAIVDRCGFYARVIREGAVRPGEVIEVRASRGRTPAWPHTGAILAGGASRRMGHDKAGLELPDGRALIEHVAAVLRPLCRQVVVVGATDALPGAPRIDDLRPGEGPLAGLEALLASGLDEQYLLVPCDMPRLDGEVLGALLPSSPAAATILRVRGEHEPRPLPVRVAATALPSVRAALHRGVRAVHRWLSTMDVRVIDVPAAWADRLADVDTPEQLDALSAEMGAPP